MKFIIDTYRNIWQYFWNQQLFYISEEHSFYMGSIINKIDIELIINQISLVVSDNIIVSVNGFCGIDKSMLSTYQIPEYRKGILKVEHDLNYGFAYGISDNNDYEYPVYVNTKIGWICIGNPEGKGNAVEFISNCVAVINDKNELVSLWLKPEKFPDI